MNPTNFLVVGVGGQGTILASNILAEVGLSLGYDVKKAEVHGMSQRGGSVVSQVRWSEKVFSPILSSGEADILLAFEKLEAVRFIDFLKPNGVIIVNDYAIVPVSVHTSGISYPTNADIQSALSARTKHIHWVKGLEIAEDVGNVRVANVVLLGALSAFLAGEPEHWLNVIGKLVPAKARQVNETGFIKGRSFLLKT